MKERLLGQSMDTGFEHDDHRLALEAEALEADRLNEMEIGSMVQV
jgi:hypothetical protein